MLYKKSIYLIIILFFIISCSSSNQNINRINSNLLIKNSSKYIVILPIKSKIINKSQKLKISLIIHKELSQIISPPVIPFWKINQPYYKNIKILLKKKNLTNSDISFILPKIKIMDNKYNIEVNLLNSEKEEILHFIGKTKQMSNIELKNALYRVIKRMARFIKKQKLIVKPTNEYLNIVNMLKKKDITQKNKIEIIELLYPKIKYEEISKSLK